MQTLSKKILESARNSGEGEIYTAREFLHLGKRAAVDQALSRLTKEGECLRIGRGRYVLPVRTRFGTRAPSAHRVVEAFAEASGETVAPSGAAAANQLGLTTQVPIRHVSLTSGKSRRFYLGKQVVELKHAPAWQLRQPNEKAGHAIRALAWIGHANASEAVRQIRSTMSAREQAELLASRGSAIPTWLAEAISGPIADSSLEAAPTSGA